MALEKANEVYSRLLHSASKFVSPALKTYFIRKATDDFHCFSRKSRSDPSLAERYVKKQGSLADSLDRASTIYNMYRDPDAAI
ncbi:LYR motif-containing protein 4 [Pancytospora epiphaga]|nr:LYR motif-containing protein 4 [Pancytospora epiphaga]